MFSFIFAFCTNAGNNSIWGKDQHHLHNHLLKPEQRNLNDKTTNDLHERKRTSQISNACCVQEYHRRNSCCVEGRRSRWLVVKMRGHTFEALSKMHRRAHTQNQAGIRRSYQNSIKSANDHEDRPLAQVGQIRAIERTSRANSTVTLHIQECIRALSTLLRQPHYTSHHWWYYR